jgi:hypothetical protein
METSEKKEKKPKEKRGIDEVIDDMGDDNLDEDEKQLGIIEKKFVCVILHGYSFH